jgi:release factor glutamine methyltransferase
LGEFVLDDKIWTIQNTLQWMTQKFKSLGFESATLEAQILAEHALQLNRIQLYTHHEQPLSVAERTSLRELVKRRISGEPIAYIVGKKQWYLYELQVDKRVLIPRPETETIIDFTLKILKFYQLTPKIIFDLCTGSGCIALACAKEFPNALIVAVDISPEALEVAKINCYKHKAFNVEFILGDVTQEKFLIQLKEKFGQCETLLANPPYLPNNDLEWQTRLKFEPHQALSGGKTGIEIPIKMIQAIEKSNILSSKSFLMVELGENQPSLFLEETNCLADKKSYFCEDNILKIRTNQFFTLTDLSLRERFLAQFKNP